MSMRPNRLQDLAEEQAEREFRLANPDWKRPVVSPEECDCIKRGVPYISPTVLNEAAGETRAERIFDRARNEARDAA
jgi:hypothetical protein